ncbi:Lrp/AsnC family transcriptional regulator [Pseudonocardia humida]|uniref:Lrp/AsnC family transcriptional regulator n=1 Tax=Pseudonocardia humida TaxID=2800819 RepID=UPI00207C378E|nr:Lrp/AsnC family transcriptional regulator [Pseudonocardia humida]
MTPLDDVDRKLLALLEADGRRTFADLAGEVALSQPAVKRRVDRLVAVGVIIGFTAVVDRARLDRPLEAFCELRFQGTTSPEDMEALRRDLPEVEAVYVLAGDFDALCHLRVRDMAHLREVVARLRATTGVVGTKTLMVMSSVRGPR